jgi:hypothetical protein
MWTPWKNKSGISKAIAILATVASIATVSCGVNWYVAFSGIVYFDSNAFGIVCWIELATLVISSLGVAVLTFMQWFSDMRTSSAPESYSDADKKNSD